ncbi:MAG TPA: diguanylate cyclase, partial [Acidisoma sp.]|nr:diguanylate cyclase [Acidisoma sp.]
MALDPATILVTQILIILLVSVSYFVTWLGAREEDALLWMSGAALLTALGLTARFCLPPPASIILSNGLIEDGGCGLWLACRRLRRASAPAGTLALPPLLWCLLPLLPALFDDIGRRVVIAYLVLGLFFLLAAAEVWKLERDSGPLRLYIFALLGFQTAIDFVWAAYNVALPPAGHAALVTLPGVAITDLLSLFTTLLITIGFIVLARERMVRTYRRVAMLDAVTGIANRRAFDERLAELLVLAARRGTSLALVMMDADHFKSYNDRYGHVEGDACLRSLAQS